MDLASAQLDAMERAMGALHVDVRKAWDALVEQVGDLEEWPAIHSFGGKYDIFAAHLKRPTRWQGTLFVLCNGVDPRVWVEWLLARIGFATVRVGQVASECI